MTFSSLCRLVHARVLACVCFVFLASTISAQITLPPGASWRLRSPKPWVDQLTGVVKTDTRLIATGGGSVIMESFDEGLTWSSTRLDSSVSLQGPCYIAWNGRSGDTSQVLVSTPSGMWTSVHGDDWYRVHTDLKAAAQLTVLCWDGTRWGALQSTVDDNGPHVDLMVSGDGAQWASYYSWGMSGVPTFNQMMAQQIGSDKHPTFIVFGSEFDSSALEKRGVIYTVRDGYNSNPALGGNVFLPSIGEPSEFLSGVWTGAQWIALGRGNDSDLAYTVSTTSRFNKLSSLPSRVSSLSWDGPHLVALGLGHGFTSTDAVTWTGMTGVPADLTCNTLISVSGGLLSVGDQGRIYTSPDVNTWTQQSPIGPQVAYTSLATSHGVVPSFDLAATVTGRVLRSTDGDTWTDVLSAPSHSTPYVTSILAVGDHFAGVGASSFCPSSADGTSWTMGYSFGLNTMRALAAQDSQLIALGASQADGREVIFHSTDQGNTWSAATLPVLYPALRAGLHFGSAWVAVGDQDTLLTSADGSGWTPVNLGSTSTNLNALASDGYTLVAMGDGDFCYTSTDGVTWTGHDLHGSLQVSALVWTGLNYVATGANGSVYTSQDGVVWTSQSSGTLNALNAAVWDGTQVLAAGAGGAVLSSDSLPTVDFTRASQAVPESFGTVPVEVTLSRPLPTPVTLPFTVGGTASAADFSINTASVTFGAFETSKIINVAITPDFVIEKSLRTVILTLGSTTGVRPGRPTFTLTILDDDGSPTVQFLTAARTVAENAGEVKLAIALSWPAPTSLSVNLTHSGTAPVSAIPDSVTFAQGSMLSFITLPVGSDAGTTDTALQLNLTGGPDVVVGSTSTFTLNVRDNSPASNTLGKQWQLREPRTGSGEIQRQIVTLPPNGDTPVREVILGDGGSVLTSDDQGVTWVPHQSDMESGDSCTGAVWTGSLLVAVTAHGQVLVSPEGVSWARIPLPGGPASLSLRAVATSGGRVVAVGTDLGAPAGIQGLPLIYSSTDGVHWQQEQTPADVTGDLKSVTWNGSQFMAVGSTSTLDAGLNQSLPAGLVLTSADGLVWTLCRNWLPGVPLFAVQAVTASGTVLVLDGQGTGYTSADNGLTWLTRALGTGHFTGAVWNGTSKALAYGGTQVSASTNGRLWTPKTSPGDLVSVTWTGIRFVGITAGGGIFTSNDGITWATRVAGGTSNPLLAVTWGGTQFVAVGGDAAGLQPSLIETSPDGQTWTHRTSPAKGALDGIAWNGSLFVAVGINGTILTSPNGVTWTPRKSGSPLDLHDVIWAANQFIAVGGNADGEDGRNIHNGSILLASPNGVTWTPRTIPTVHPLQGIAFDGLTYVAVGRASSASSTSKNGVGLISVDSILWFDFGGPDLRKVVSNGNYFVATSGYGFAQALDLSGFTTIRTSPLLPNGQPPASSSTHGITWTGNQFVAVGEDGNVFVSPDSQTWTVYPTQVSNTLYGIASNGIGTFVATGSNGTIQTSKLNVVTPLSEIDFAPAFEAYDTDVTSFPPIVLSAASNAKVVVPFHLEAPDTGDTLVMTGPAARLILPSSPLVFYPGETTKYFPVKRVDFNTPKGPGGIKIVLDTPTPNAVLGTQTTLEISLTGNSHMKPQVSGLLWPGLIPMGQPIPLSDATMTSDQPIAYRWKKNGIPIPYAFNPQLVLPKMALSDAGIYAVTGTNASGSTTISAEVDVYESATRNIVPADEKDITMIQRAAGRNLSYDWYKGGSGTALTPSSHLIFNANKSSLTIKHPLTATDQGIYQCQVTANNFGASAPANAYQVTLAYFKPVASSSAFTLPDGQLGVLYSASLTAAVIDPGQVATWVAAGLPKGLSCDPITGQISGTPLASGRKNITITANNGLGSLILHTTLTITATLPPGITGSWRALEMRDPDNNNLGSRLDITINANATFTGKMTVGTTTSPLVGTLSVDGTSVSASSTFFVAGLFTSYSLFFDTTSSPALLSIFFTQSTRTGSDVNHSFLGWPVMPAPSIAPYAGRYSYSLALSDTFDIANPDLPHGTGFGTAIITTSGEITFAGKTADGASFTSSNSLVNEGQGFLYGVQYGGKASLIGTLQFTLSGITPSYPDSSVEGNNSVTWSKLPDASIAGARNYPLGIGFVGGFYTAAPNITLHGSKYVAPDPGNAALNLTYTAGSTNAHLGFSGAGLDGYSLPPDVTVNLQPGGAIDLLSASANPRATTLNVAPGGAFSGTFTLSDLMPNEQPLKRTGTYSGQIVRIINGALMPPTVTGVGYFLLPQLPSPDISPMPSPNSTPILSGAVTLEAK